MLAPGMPPTSNQLIRHLDNPHHRLAIHELAKRSNRKLVIYEEIVNCLNSFPKVHQSDHSNCTIDIVELTNSTCPKVTTLTPSPERLFQRNFVYSHNGESQLEVHLVDLYDLLEEFGISKFHILAAFIGRAYEFPHFFKRIQQKLHQLNEL